MSINYALPTMVRISILLLFAGIINACSRKGDESSVTYTRLNQEGLNYVQLPLGRYFVYRDSATNRMDSIVVTESRIEVIRSTSGSITSTSSYEAYWLTLTNKTAGLDTLWLKGAAAAVYSNTNFSLLSQSNNSYDLHMFRYPTGTSGLFPDDRTINTMTVEGRTYNQIILTTGNSNTYSKFYWAKGIGLIRYERAGSNPKTFTLMRNG